MDKMDKGSEEYVKGRRAGVEGTYGEDRPGNSAEKTIFPASGNSDGGGEDSLGEKASSIYRKAVENRGDDMGDKALTER
jgi:hypothetical protein